MLADQIKAVAQREAIAKLDQGEAEIKAQVEAELGKPFIELDHEQRDLITRWASWCEVGSVRRCPAKPAVIARWVLTRRNDSQGSVVAMLAAIEALHDLNGLANPVKTPIVSRALEQIFKIDPPRGWTRQEKDSFATLPPLTRNAIARRDKEREKEVRRLQNERADEKQRIAAAATKPAETKELTQ